PSTSTKGYDHVVAQVVKLVEMLKKESGLIPDKIGMGTPGILDPQTQKMKNCNSQCLNERPLKKDMERLLNAQIEIANDANCFALAEARYGIVKDMVPDAKVVFGVIMGTGVGGGVVINGKVWNGKQGIAGEWGHNVLDEKGELCYCGKNGCVEKTISGPEIEKFYKSITKQSLPLKEILERHLAGTDEYATQTIKRLLTMFGKAISIVINILDPDAIVIGGGMGNIDLLYTEGVEEIKKYVFNDKLETPILKPKLGDSAGVFGAASLVE
ncbi:MAG TPA: ROK family protein, partial [Bacteroidia bacterium]|nr:ROK family protein [Bacteroidia bacterium]